ncbi:MAG TPA: hypothetical protein VKT31_10745 [Solirubrobacteraceae bacterium]|nr:hypothetical protein [Solirubrobacteraceae bacterium]
MSFIHRNARLLAVALSCLALGAAGSAIASAGAATSSTSSHAVRGGARGRAGLMAMIRRGTVHASLITYTKKQGFVTVTIDRGFVQSVSGNSLTMREGTRTATYKTLTLSLPAGTVVRDNRARASLSALKPGEHVLVVQGPQRALVVARG